MDFTTIKFRNLSALKERNSIIADEKLQLNSLIQNNNYLAIYLFCRAMSIRLGLRIVRKVCTRK